MLQAPSPRGRDGEGLSCNEHTTARRQIPHRKNIRAGGLRHHLPRHAGTAEPARSHQGVLHARLLQPRAGHRHRHPGHRRQPRTDGTLPGEVPKRGQGHRPAGPPQHHPHLRHLRGKRHCLLRDGVHRGRIAVAVGKTPRRPARAGGRGLHPQRGGSPEACAFPWHQPPGREAGQHHGAEEGWPRLPARLRPVQAVRRRGQPDQLHPLGHQPRLRPHRAIHARRHEGVLPADRHLRPGRHAVLPGDGQHAAPRRRTVYPQVGRLPAHRIVRPAPGHRPRHAPAEGRPPRHRGKV